MALVYFKDIFCHIWYILRIVLEIIVLWMVIFENIKSTEWNSLQNRPNTFKYSFAFGTF